MENTIQTRKYEMLFPHRYWKYKENVLKELKSYIELHNHLINMDNDKMGKCLNSVFYRYSYNKSELCKELGYDFLSLTKRRYHKDYFNDIENYKKEIIALSEKLNRVPMVTEIFKNLQISYTTLNKYGGIDFVCDLVSDKYNNLLQDDSGYYNRSRYEYMVAQFLIQNNIPYKRDTHPFPYPYNQYRSDFTLNSLDGIQYEIEVWGYWIRESPNQRVLTYLAKKEFKMKLYQTYNINLISVEGEQLSINIDHVQEYLATLFSPYMHLNFQKVDNALLIAPSSLSDDELYNRIMNCSDNAMFVPHKKDLIEKDSAADYEMVRRYGSLNNFAKKYNLLAYKKFGTWNKELIFKIMEHMRCKYGKLLSVKELDKYISYKDDLLISGFPYGVKKVYLNIIDAYLDFYKSLVDQSICLTNNDIHMIYSFLNHQHGYTTKLCTPERIKLSHEILTKNQSITNN